MAIHRQATGFFSPHPPYLHAHVRNYDNYDKQHFADLQKASLILPTHKNGVVG